MKSCCPHLMSPRRFVEKQTDRLCKKKVGHQSHVLGDVPGRYAKY